ncbi:MAG: 16S rRNA (uracil(1498)-N(3))-methyltransferase [Vicinamibacterales bacterium]
MSIQPRFHAPEARAAGDVIALPDDEAQHLLRVLRLLPGAAVRVFDGRGHEFDAVVEDPVASGFSRKAVAVRLLAARAAAAEPRVALTLAQAVLKSDKMDDVVRDAVMLGVAAIHPIVTARTEVSLATLERGRRRERWQRIAVSSAKQCGRAVVPAVAEPADLDTLLARVRSMAVPGQALMCVEPDAAAGDLLSLADVPPAPPHEATLLIGPEGGWEPRELEAADVCRKLTLGGRTIRADAMPVVAIAALFARWGEF